MSSIGTLYVVPDTTAHKLYSAIAALGGFTFDLPTGYTHYETNKTAAFTDKFASGKIPAFEDKDGFTLFETVAIARYFAALAPNAKLLGNSPKDAALVDQWLSYFNSEIRVHLLSIWFMLNERVPYNKPADNKAREDVKRALDVVEKHLATRTFFIGERLTLADIVGSLVYKLGYSLILDSAFRASHPNTFRWFNTIVNQPKIKEVYGENELVDKPKQYTPPAKPKKEEKPKEEKKPKKKEVEEEEEEDDAVPEEPKAKNPLDLLPKSTFNLEDWKRAYSNMDTRGAGGSIEWFNEKFDPEGFSVWKVTFKYPEELTQVFMSSNQIGGFFNRLEASRKYLFGSVGVLGESNNSIITGVFILRGPEIKPVVEVAPDWESYEYERLDYKGAGKEFFDAALAWDLEVGGKKWADGKNFK